MKIKNPKIAKAFEALVASSATDEFPAAFAALVKVFQSEAMQTHSEEELAACFNPILDTGSLGNYFVDPAKDPARLIGSDEVAHRIYCAARALRRIGEMRASTGRARSAFDGLNTEAQWWCIYFICAAVPTHLSSAALREVGAAKELVFRLVVPPTAVDDKSVPQ